MVFHVTPFMPYDDGRKLIIRCSVHALCDSHPQAVGDHIAALEGAVEQIPRQFLQQGSSGTKRYVLNGPSVLLHAFHNLTNRWNNTDRD